jgi:multidrug efflux pump subunit AcrB
MTTLTTILGLLPLALGIGEGATPRPRWPGPWWAA